MPPARSLWPIDVIGGLALDMRLHSRRFIRVEFALGTLLFLGVAAVEFIAGNGTWQGVAGGAAFVGLALNSIAVLVASPRAALRIHEPPPATTAGLAKITLWLGALIIIPLALVIALSAQWRAAPPPEPSPPAA